MQVAASPLLIVFVGVGQRVWQAERDLPRVGRRQERAVRADAHRPRPCRVVVEPELHLHHAVYRDCRTVAGSHSRSGPRSLDASTLSSISVAAKYWAFTTLRTHVVHGPVTVGSTHAHRTTTRLPTTWACRTPRRVKPPSS